MSPKQRERTPPREKRVAYLDPLTQTITTEKYVKSHIELLAEEASPIPDDGIDALDLDVSEVGQTRDGGMTPGPFEEMRRRMVGLGSEDGNGANAAKKRREKKRKWVWTIGGDDGEGEGVSPVTAVHYGEGHVEMRD